MTGQDGRDPDNLIRIDWYPGDYLSDPRVAAMTRLQEHAYLRLLNFQARAGPLAADLSKLAALARCDRPDEFKQDIWPGIKDCFIVKGSRVWNPRMERERQAAIGKIRAAREAGRKGNEKRWGNHEESSRPDRDPIADGSRPDRDPIAKRMRSPAAAAAAAAAAALPDIGLAASLVGGADSVPAGCLPGCAGPDGPDLRPAALADLWTETNPDLPQPKRPLTDGIKKALLVAIKREAASKPPRDWRETFLRVSRSDKLNGRSFDWSCPGILWAVGPKNLANLDAGQHDNRVNTPKRTGRLAEMDASADRVCRNLTGMSLEEGLRASNGHDHDDDDESGGTFLPLPDATEGENR